MKLLHGILLFASMEQLIAGPPELPDILFPPQTKSDLPVSPVIKLEPGKYYVIKSPIPRVVDWSGDPSVTITYRNGKTDPLTLPVEWVVGWPADKVDTELGLSTITFKDEFLYIVKAPKEAKASSGVLEIIPAINKLDDKGKQVPLSKGDIVRKSVDVGAGQAPQPSPKPIDPIVPNVVSSFRVIFVYESEDNLTAVQKSVIFGKAVSDYLNVKATKEGNLPGWRRYDKDTGGDSEQPTMKALWQAVKPNVTSIPCYVIEVNGKAEILPLPVTVAACVAELKKYAGDK